MTSKTNNKYLLPFLSQLDKQYVQTKSIIPELLIISTKFDHEEEIKKIHCHQIATVLYEHSIIKSLVNKIPGNIEIHTSAYCISKQQMLDLLDVVYTAGYEAGIQEHKLGE